MGSAEKMEPHEGEKKTDRMATPEEIALVLKMLEEAGDPHAAIVNFQKEFESKRSQAERLALLRENGIVEEEYLSRLPSINGKEEEEIIGEA